jgi:UDP-3-O-[3-hydroxymyristoyl] glucosamine N-acyltransferase
VADITTGDLAAALGLLLRGDATRLITGAAALEEAAPAHLAFVGSAKFFAAGALSAAGCLIAPPEFPQAGDRAVLESAQPRAHFAQALVLLYPEPGRIQGIHPSAVVHPCAMVDGSAEIGPYVRIGAGARIGARTRIADGCSIDEETVIGADCRLHPRVTIYPRVTVGARCVIHSGSVLGADGFGFEMAGGAWRKVPQVGTVIVGDDVEIGANCCIDRATLGSTVIGDGTKLDNIVHIAHNCRIGRHVVIAAQTGLAGGVTVGDYAVMGGQVGVGDKARIESRAIVGSGAGILTSKIVRAGEPVWGTPARPLRQYLAQLATLSRIARRRGEK